MFQKQKTNPSEDEKKGKPGSTGPDAKLDKALADGKDLASRLDEATKRKKGHWESCCGTRIWIED